MQIDENYMIRAFWQIGRESLVNPDDNFERSHVQEDGILDQVTEKHNPHHPGFPKLKKVA